MRMSEETKKMLFIISCFGIIIIILSADFLDALFIRELYRYKKLEGYVESKYMDSSNKRTTYLFVNGTIPVITGINYSLYDSIAIGDYLKKERGSLTYEITRGSSKKYFYPIANDYKLYTDSIVKIRKR